MVEPTRNNENQFRNTLAQQLIIYNCNNDTLTLTLTLTLTNPKTTPKLLLTYNSSTTRLNDSTLRLTTTYSGNCHATTAMPRFLCDNCDNNLATLLCAALYSRLGP